MSEVRERLDRRACLYTLRIYYFMVCGRNHDTGEKEKLYSSLYQKAIDHYNANHDRDRDSHLKGIQFTDKEKDDAMRYYIQ